MFPEKSRHHYSMEVEAFLGTFKKIKYFYLNWTFKFIIPELPDGDEVIAEVLGHVKSHEEHVVVDVLGLDPPHPTHARGPVAAVVREVAHVLTAQTAQLI